MAIIKKQSAYHNLDIVLTTKHKKSVAIAPVFLDILGAHVQEVTLDTDQLGTFSQEIARKGTALECVQKKCEWGMAEKSAHLGLANEGSFGPHPYIPFIASDQEIMYFIDKQRNIHLAVTEIASTTNYQTTTLQTYEELINFAKKALFPSHALILKPYSINDQSVIFKGIDNFATLEHAFYECKKLAQNISIETDMRAHLNPTRMNVIKNLAIKMAERLASWCPSCSTPGWGIIDTQIGLPCDNCDSETDLIQSYIFGCQKCPYKKIKNNPKNQKTADPLYCGYCNP